MDPSHTPESFRGLLLCHRGRTGLVQRELAVRAGVSRRSMQDWEAGLTLPTAERLRALIRALLGAGGLTRGREVSEARELWAAVEREEPRLHAPFDEEWLAGLLARPESSTAAQSMADFGHNLAQAVMFRRYGFLAAIVTGVAMYLVWHVAYGNFICQC
jgi:transcriptional regulator with XRE-family HTH domain